ncbi:hypothetical protein PtrM4_099280 [Pyrenophora tritici-repentis]|uniref:Uncharacterized protein n=1 Tax=Pyrenophora tritici-repentis TaxID=45151 RepID=A0A2W1H4Q4_9PLEO|nr:hypothetical protein A1F99_080690 [Pyrenophora tritici-repentis]KAF7572428.1 hypothetical protein PtrM4_099280 [Pyrenophora tritici-repentis]
MASLAKKRRLTESSSPEEHAAAHLVLAKRGDVLLELSKDGAAAGTLLVSSIVLGLASPIFDAMFNGSFAEGQGLSAASPKKIALPDDDSTAMTLFCKIAHMQTTRLNNTLSFDTLADLAVVCDKYRCTESVRPWLQLWIHKRLANPGADKFEKLIFVAYVCDLPKEFEEVTLACLRSRTYIGEMCNITHGFDIVPLQIIDELRCKSEHAYTTLRNKLYGKDFEELLASRCSNASSALQSYLGFLSEHDVTLNNSLSLKQLSYIGRAMQDPELVGCSLKHDSCVVNKIGNMGLIACYALKEACKGLKGLCLDCFREKFLGYSSINCRLGHAASISPADSN